MTGQENIASVKTETWCDRDEHNRFELFVDFNEWLEGEEGAALRV